MSWAQIENKHRGKYGRNFIICEDPSEREFLTGAILESFNFLKHEYVEQAFNECCKGMIFPCDRKKCLQTIKGYVGKNITMQHVSNYSYF